MIDTKPLSTASLPLQAAIHLIAPHATRWMYATPERVGVLVDEPNGSHRLICGDELDRAYAMLADADLCAESAMVAEAAAILRPARGVNNKWTDLPAGDCQCGARDDDEGPPRVNPPPCQVCGQAWQGRASEHRCGTVQS